MQDYMRGRDLAARARDYEVFYGGEWLPVKADDHAAAAMHCADKHSRLRLGSVWVKVRKNDGLANPEMTVRVTASTKVVFEAGEPYMGDPP